MMKTSLVRSCSKIRRQMIFNINHLSHVFDALSQSLIALAISSCIIRPKIGYTWWEVLVLGCWTMSFDGIEIKLVLIRCSTYASFVYHALIHLVLHVLFATCCLLLLIFHFLCGIAELIEFSIVDIHWLRLWPCLIWTRRMYLSVVAACLWSSFNLILDLLGLFLIWVPDLNALTNLLVMWSI